MLCALVLTLFLQESQAPALPTLYITLLSLKHSPLSSMDSFSLAVSVLLVFLCKCISLFLFYFFFICWNTVVLVSAVQLSESTMYINVSTASWISLPLPGVSSLSHHRAQSWAPYVRNIFPLAICFTRGSVYRSNLISQFIPPTTVSTCPFSTSASLV